MIFLLYKSNVKAMNRNWSKQKTNPTLKTKKTFFLVYSALKILYFYCFIYQLLLGFFFLVSWSNQAFYLWHLNNKFTILTNLNIFLKTKNALVVTKLSKNFAKLDNGWHMIHRRMFGWYLSCEDKSIVFCSEKWFFKLKQNKESLSYFTFFMPLHSSFSLRR